MSRSRSAELSAAAGTSGLRWGAALVLLVIALAWWPGSPLQALDDSLYDARLRMLAPPQADAQVVVVDIDERALADHGRWPWPRRQLAALLQAAVQDGGARLVGLDLVLAQPDQSSGLAAVDRLAQGALRDDAGFQAAWQTLRPQLDDDGQLAAALQRLPVVLGFHLSNEAGAAQVGALPTPLLPVAMLGPAAASLPAWVGHGGNLAQLQQAATLGGGHLNASLDSDGTVRRVPLLVQHQQGVQPTLSLAMARVLLGGPGALAALSLEPADGPLRALHLRGAAGALRVPVDAQAQALVPFSAVPSTRVSAADLLAGRLPADALRGKAVLVGVSAPGLIDQHRTPVDDAMLGTLVHAELLSGMLQQRVAVVPAWAPAMQVAGLALLAAVLLWQLPRRPLWQGCLLAAGLVAGTVALNLWAWSQQGWVLPLAASLLVPPLLLVLHGVLAYRRATGARRQLAQLFGQYVPPELVDEMSLAPERHTMGSRSAELTVLFADVSGFSAVAERMPPAELGAMMNLLFSHLTDVVRAHRGTLDKYIGDAVMAFWGAPLDDPAHARHAVDAALAMQARLPQIHAELAARGWPALQLNIGINTGVVVVGDMGSRHRRAYTVMGDVVNLAARLQAFSSRYGLGLVVGEATQTALGDAPCLPLGTLPVRGRATGLPAWAPLAPPPQGPADAGGVATRWAQLLAAVQAGRPVEAHALLDVLQQQPGLAGLCRWQRQVLAGQPGAPAAD
ncbi:CHASE2 domain-containing protein [Pseudaquabacterium pictum]|uniref:CHASE2 domain-containing protein n=1 Tax=Pseudaquabacterium pictum TaxID=2315236 RepID=UPI001396C32E|nr:adenylate/guanylate cyclase domain-containing protein [Rubrivivax pictus]